MALVSWLLVCLFGSIVAAIENNDITLKQNVVQWIRENGGFFHESQEFLSEPPFGVVATQPIKEGEMLTSVPWKCVIYAGTDDLSDGSYCDSIQLLIDEMKKDEGESFYAPYTAYLLSAPPVDIPTAWSQEGRDLLKQVYGKEARKYFDKSAQSEWIDDCGGNNNEREIQAALLLWSRGDDDMLTPLYDMHNHRNGKWFNTESYHVHGVKHEIKASRDIEAGEQIYLSYNLCTNCYNRFHDYGTPELWRDYGFIEEYPQRWYFHKKEFGFEVDEKEDDGTLQVTWFDKDHSDPEFGKWYDVTDESIGHLRSEIARLDAFNKTTLQPLLKEDSDIPQSELKQIEKYAETFVRAMELAVQAWPKTKSLDNQQQGATSDNVKDDSSVEDKRTAVDDDDDDDDDDDFDSDECPAGMAVNGKCVAGMSRWEDEEEE